MTVMDESAEVLARQKIYLERFRATAIITVPPRLSFLDRLYKVRKPIRITELAKKHNIPVCLAMRHLEVMEEEHLVKKVNNGSFVITEKGIELYERGEGKKKSGTEMMDPKFS